MTVRYDPAGPARAKAGFEAWFFAFGGAVGAAGLGLVLYGVAKLV
ncbi:MAG: hypothetical protein JWM10_2110 [Myxococcaceae bacterium]|nr:hypothetical protein [Myxococcaceae bacterium]